DRLVGLEGVGGGRAGEGDRGGLVDHAGVRGRGQVGGRVGGRGDAVGPVGGEVHGRVRGARGGHHPGLEDAVGDQGVPVGEGDQLVGPEGAERRDDAWHAPGRAWGSGAGGVRGRAAGGGL